jgi:uncharacterized membrane protein HdeD (DUF308 family)
MMARWLAVAEGTVNVFVYVLGSIMILTGLLHIFQGIPSGRRNGGKPRLSQSRGESRTRSWTGVLLGAFEVVLGALLLLNPEERVPGVYLAATIWALIGGFILIGDAVRMRRLRRQAGSVDQAASRHDETQADIEA